jgi:hypothetical protein
MCMRRKTFLGLIEDLVAIPDEDLEFLNRLRNKYGLSSGDLIEEVKEWNP